MTEETPRYRLVNNDGVLTPSREDRYRQVLGLKPRETQEQIEAIPNDQVNHPSHYTAYNVEVIELTEDMNFCRGNAVKYIARAGLKNPDTEIEDLEKARWYIEREIMRLHHKNSKKA